jgi:hypothetical protein
MRREREEKREERKTIRMEESREMRVTLCGRHERRCGVDFEIEVKSFDRQAGCVGPYSSWPQTCRDWRWLRELRLHQCECCVRP